MKRSAIKRGTTPLRRTRIKPVSDKRRAEAPEHAVIRERVFARDRFCQVYALGYTRYAVGPCHGPMTPHHRRKASAGGGYSFENLVAACLHHNEAMESDAGLARWAHSVGLVVKRGDDEWASLGAVRR